MQKRTIITPAITNKCVEMIKSNRQPKDRVEKEEKDIGVGEKKVFGTFSALASSSHQKKGIGLSEDRRG